MPPGVGKHSNTTENARSAGRTHAAQCVADDFSSCCSLLVTLRHLLDEVRDVVRDAENVDARHLVLKMTVLKMNLQQWNRCPPGHRRLKAWIGLNHRIL